MSGETRSPERGQDYGLCRNGAMHYCPNCDNTFRAASEARAGEAAASSPVPAPEQIATANIRDLLSENQRLKQQAADDRANYLALREELASASRGAEDGLLEDLILRWQGLEQQALEPPANLEFAELAHKSWTVLAALRSGRPDTPKEE